MEVSSHQNCKSWIYLVWSHILTNFWILFCSWSIIITCLFLNLHLPWTPMDSTYSIPYLHLKHPPPMDSNGLSWTLMDFLCCFFFLTSISHSITTCFATTGTMLLLNFTMRLSWSCRSLGSVWFSQWLLWCEYMCSGVDDTIYCHSQLSSGGIWCMAQQFQTRLYNCPPHRLGWTWTGQPDWLLLIGTGDEMNRVIIYNGNTQSSYKVCRQGLCHSDITVMLLFYKYYI